ncbi:MAG: response regulator transcription factor [Bacteroidota bacterium]
MNTTYNILIADDHILIAETLKYMLETKWEGKVQIFGMARNGKELIDILNTQSTKPDIVILDIHMPKMDGIEAAEYIKEYFSEIKILILSTEVSRYTVKSVLELGVEGYLPKESHPDEIMEAIERIMNGDSHYSQTVQNKITKILTEPPPSRYSLSSREKDVIREIKSGKKTTEISESLNISPNTVLVHRRNIYKKLKINSVAELVTLVTEKNLID